MWYHKVHRYYNYAARYRQKRKGVPILFIQTTEDEFAKIAKAAEQVRKLPIEIIDTQNSIEIQVQPSEPPPRMSISRFTQLMLDIMQATTNDNYEKYRNARDELWSAIQGASNEQNRQPVQL